MATALIKSAKEKFNSASTNTDLAAPISPTNPEVISLVLSKLEAPKVVYDLGCGDGRWLVAFAKAFDCRCVGIDIDKSRLAMARSAIERENLADKIEVREGSVFDDIAGIDDADVVVVYLFRDAMRRINHKFKGKSGLTIVSIGFALRGDDVACCTWEGKVQGIHVYIYKIK